ncbi:MAG: LemA family protein [Lachnospiraceae bacterium]
MSERKSGMNQGTKVLLIVLGVIIIYAVISIFSYNGLVKQEEAVNTAYSDISVQLQRRNDLIPNLVSTVKGYAAHETQVYSDVASARSKLMASSTVADTAAADQEVTSSLNRLLAIAEAYPELKANENFLSLQDQLEGTENRISVARRDYNQAAKSYNTKIRSFPTSVMAGIFGFEKKQLFEVAEGAETVPEVSF